MTSEGIMASRWRAFAVVAATVLVCGPALLAQNPQRKLSDTEKKEIQTILKMVDEVATGQPAPNDLSLTWLRDDLMKAQGKKEYVPFIVAFDASKINGGKVSMYWRVVSKDAPPPAEPAKEGGKKDDGRKDDKDKKGKVEYAYEDMTTAALPSGQGAQTRLSRSFTVLPGNYDVYVVVKEPLPDKVPKNAPPAKVSLLKKSVTIPDLWNGELTTSSVIVAERIEPLAAPLTPSQQVERPYALGSMEIVPTMANKFQKSTELSTFVLIYNAKTDSANKPDVSVEYNFYAKQAGVEKFFNKTSPQTLNAQTLPPEFDFSAGHQLQSGQAVPLASFPEGDYRLEIKITDKLANKTVSREVNFSIAGS